MFSLYFVVQENSGSDYRHGSVLPQRLETEAVTCWCFVLKLIMKIGRKMRIRDYNFSRLFRAEMEPEHASAGNALLVYFEGASAKCVKGCNTQGRAAEYKASFYT